MGRGTISFPFELVGLPKKLSHIDTELTWIQWHSPWPSPCSPVANVQMCWFRSALLLYLGTFHHARNTWWETQQVCIPKLLDRLGNSLSKVPRNVLYLVLPENCLKLRIPSHSSLEHIIQGHTLTATPLSTRMPNRQTNMCFADLQGANYKAQVKLVTW